MSDTKIYSYDYLRENYGENSFRLYAYIPFEDMLLDPTDAPMSIQFKTGLQKLKPVQSLIMNSGQVDYATYHPEIINGVYVDPLVKIDNDWIRDDTPSRQLIQRNGKACWTMVGDDDDGLFWNEGAEFVKVFQPKPYSPQQAAIADSRRRQNIVDELSSLAETFNVLPLVQTMMNDFSAEKSSYVSAAIEYDVRLIQNIFAYNEPWINTDVTLALRSIGRQAQEGTTLKLAICSALDYNSKELPKLLGLV